jgi:hypothetical protein
MKPRIPPRRESRLINTATINALLEASQSMNEQTSLVFHKVNRLIVT